MGSNANQGYNAFISSLESLCEIESISQFPRLTFIYGKSEYLLHKAAKSLQACWAKFPAAECVTYEGSEVDNDLFTNMATQSSMFGANIFYVIKRAEAVKNMTEYLEPIESQKLKNHICIVFRSEKTLEALLKDVKRLKGFILHALEPAPFEYQNYIDQLAQKAQINFSADAKVLLIETLGKDLALLDNEILRLSLIFDGHKQPLRAADISPYLGLLKEDFAMTVRTYLLSGKAAKAQALIADLLARGESSLAIMGILTKHSRTAMKFAQGVSAEGIPSYLVGQYRTYFNRVGVSKLKHALQLCISGDRLLKSKKVSDELVLAQVVDSLS